MLHRGNIVERFATMPVNWLLCPKFRGMAQVTNKREFDMRLGKFFMAAAVATMAVAPAVAAPVNPASSLSISAPARAGSSVSHKGKLAGGGAFVAIIAAIAVIAGVVAVASNNDKPSSP